MGDEMALRPSMLALALAALAMLICAPAAPAVQPGLVTDLTWGAGERDRDRTFSEIRELGARWLRVEVNWGETEPEQGRLHAWSLEQADDTIRRARAQGMQVVVMVSRAPSWASGSEDRGAPPRDPRDYARFVGMLARRYAGDVIAGYEIWNEPNLSRFWAPRADATAYVALLRAASDAVRSADPHAKVVFGGLSGADVDFVRDAYRAGARGLFDVMALHPYACAQSPRSELFTRYRRVRSLMVAQRDARPMWFTEFGWSTGRARCAVSRTTQARYVRDAFRVMQTDRYVQSALYYNLRNNYWSKDSTDLEAQYGLVDTRFRAKPAYAAFRAFARREARRVTRHRARSGSRGW
ncbi:MAG: cellulase family glycosylhydrolase [Solirubrobacteraceae bacterium]